MLLQHPHDHLVREFFSDLRYAREFLSAVLPAELAEALDWTQLRSEPTTFIDENLQEQHSDLLFSLPEREGSPTQVYLLFEHKSTRDSHLLRQLLGYLAQLYATQSEPAPVIPLVFYHGATAHPVGRRLVEELGLSKKQQARYRAYIPDFAYLLFDLGRTPPQTWDSLAMRAFLAALDSARQQNRERLIEVLRLADTLLREPDSTRIVHALLVYLFHVTDLQPAQWQALLSPPPSPELEATMSSTAQQLFERGKFEGQREGKLEGQREGKLEGQREGQREGKREGKREGEGLVLERLLRFKFGEVSPDCRRRIAQADAETLLVWSERVLTAATLDEVWQDSSTTLPSPNSP